MRDPYENVSEPGFRTVDGGEGSGVKGHHTGYKRFYVTHTDNGANVNHSAHVKSVHSDGSGKTHKVFHGPEARKHAEEHADKLRKKHGIEKGKYD